MHIGFSIKPSRSGTRSPSVISEEQTLAARPQTSSCEVTTRLSEPQEETCAGEFTFERVSCLSFKRSSAMTIEVKVAEVSDSMVLNACDYLHGTPTPNRYTTPIPGSTIASVSLIIVNFSVSSTSSSSMPVIRPQPSTATLYHSLGFVSLPVFHPPEDIAPVLQTISYFDLLTCSTVASTAGLYIFKDSILALSHQPNYLMHAMLGMAAVHLSEADAIA